MSGLSALYILDLKGRVIIQRKYREDVEDECYTEYTLKSIEQGQDLPPIFSDKKGQVFFHRRHNNLIFLGVAAGNVNTVLVFTYLHQCIEVLKEYLVNLEDESVRDNFVIIYELLDEMMDNGQPQTTETKILREFIRTQENVKKQSQFLSIPASLTNTVSWRSPGIKHRKNEIFLDVVEKVNMLQNAHGHVVKSCIQGTVKGKCQLSGMPECVLGLNDKLTSQFSQSGGVDLGDVKFHQCVRLNLFHLKKEISFIPPDGDFELMSYRIENMLKPLFYVKVHEKIDNSKVIIKVTATSNFRRKCDAQSVRIMIPIHCDAYSVKGKALSISDSHVQHLSENECLNWQVASWEGQREIKMEAQYMLPSIASPNRDHYKTVPIQLHFQIPFFTLSGIQVKYLKIHEKSNYEGFPWVRYLIEQQEYHIRH